MPAKKWDDVLWRLPGATREAIAVRTSELLAEVASPAMPDPDPVTCPTCQAENRESVVYDNGSISTAMLSTPFYDKSGRRHVHDGNRVTQQLACSRGHRWGRRVANRCWCGWGSEGEGDAGSAEVVVGS